MNWNFYGQQPIDVQPKNSTISLDSLMDKATLPLGIILAITGVCLMGVIFRRWPGLFAGIVAGCMTGLSIYLFIDVLQGPKSSVFE